MAHQPDERQIKLWAAMLDGATAEDFRGPAETPEHEAFRHFWQAVSIMLREGEGVSGVHRVLSDVFWAMEDDDEDEEDADGDRDAFPIA